MILDFKSNVRFLLFSVLVGIGITIYLRITAMTWFFIIPILFLFAIFTYYQIKRNAYRFVQNYEVLLMIKLDADAYKGAYLALVQKGKRLNPLWTITKRQALARGYLFSGEFEKSQETLNSLEKEYDVFLSHDPYSYYLNQVTHGLIDLMVKGPTKKTLQKERDAFNDLPIKMQFQLKDNPNGYHQLFQNIDTLEATKDFEKEFHIIYEEKSNFMKVILHTIYGNKLKKKYEIPVHQLFTKHSEGDLLE